MTDSRPSGRPDVDALFERAAGHLDAAAGTRLDSRRGPRGEEDAEFLLLCRALEQARAQPAPATLTRRRANLLIGRACDELVPARVPRRWAPAIALLVASVVGVTLASRALWTSLQRHQPRSEEQRLAVALGGAARPARRLAVREQRAVIAEGARSLGFALGHSVRVAFRANARIAVIHSSAKKKRIAVEQGVAVVAVHGRALDEVVRVETPAGAVHVTGTVFFVAVDGESTRVGVQEGATRFVLPSGEAHAIQAGQQLRISGGRISLSALRRDDHALFASFPELTSRAPGPGRTRATQGRTTPANSSPSTSAEAVPADAPAVAGELYLQSELALAQHRPKDAAARLEALIARFPETPWAQLALFDLARLRETELADPDGATRAYQRYLELGAKAPLHREARHALDRLRARPVNAPPSSSPENFVGGRSP
ncbi:MAG: FecR domain-containing protein [Proteobacteria bacterium]|nr:FecR domain-containing protein [Pseudomonadota bacterium]